MHESSVALETAIGCLFLDQVKKKTCFTNDATRVTSKSQNWLDTAWQPVKVAESWITVHPIVAYLSGPVTHSHSRFSCPHLAVCVNYDLSWCMISIERAKRRGVGGWGWRRQKSSPWVSPVLLTGLTLLIFQMTTAMVKSTKIWLRCRKVSDVSCVKHWPFHWQTVNTIRIYLSKQSSVLQSSKTVHNFFSFFSFLFFFWQMT